MQTQPAKERLFSLSAVTAAVIVVVATGPFHLREATAGPSDCLSIKDSSERLRCYDASEKPLAPIAVPEELNSRLGRARYADVIRQLPLVQSAGLEIAVEEASRASTGGRAMRGVPRLIIKGRLDESSLHQLLTGSFVYETAKRVGYRTIEFKDTVSNETYRFDLTSKNQCDAGGQICLGPPAGPPDQDD